MKALVLKGADSVAIEERPKPTVIEATDAVVKVTHTTICGTDLHIIQGHVPSCEPGRVLGHEGTGVIESLGSGVQNFNVGDSVIISCITACGRCRYCRRGMNSHCETGGWKLGNTIDGTQAEYVRIPHAVTSLHRLPAQIDPKVAVTLSDSLPTGYECGVLNGRVQPGSTLALIGAGPVGLSALITSHLYSPSLIVTLDLDDARLEVAKSLGSDHILNSRNPDVVQEALKLTDGVGFDTVIEAVGNPITFGLCQDLVAPGGTLANLGVHGGKVDLHLEKLWDRNISITTRLVDAISTPTLIKMAETGKIKPLSLVTHSFSFGDVEQAYGTFKAAAQHKALKVVITM